MCWAPWRARSRWEAGWEWHALAVVGWGGWARGWKLGEAAAAAAHACHAGARCRVAPLSPAPQKRPPQPKPPRPSPAPRRRAPQLLQRAPPGELARLHAEAARLAALRFDWRDAPEPLAAAKDAAYCLHYYPPEDLLSGPALLTEFDEAALRRFVGRLDLAAAQVAWVSRRWAGGTDAKERWVRLCVCAGEGGGGGQ